MGVVTSKNASNIKKEAATTVERTVLEMMDKRCLSTGQNILLLIIFFPYFATKFFGFLFKISEKIQK